MLAAVAMALLAAASPGCGKKSPQADLAREFFDCADRMDKEKAGRILKIESFFPVYTGEKMDREATRTVGEVFKAPLIDAVLKKEKAFWGTGKRETVEPPMVDGDRARVRVSTTDGSKVCTIFFERSSEGNWMIVNAAYMIRSQDNQMVVY